MTGTASNPASANTWSSPSRDTRGPACASTAGSSVIRSGTSGVTEPVRRAIRALPEQVWHLALDQDGTLRESAEIAELTSLVRPCPYPVGTRIIVRRERPHPGAQLSLFDQDEGLRHQVFVTDTPFADGGSTQFLEARHRGHATVEDHIRCGKTTGFGRFPSRRFPVNAAWLELSLAAIGLLAWTRVLLLDGELATAEPRKLRYRMLHAAARVTRGSRRLRSISATWPWRHELAAAFHRLDALPRPASCRPPSAIHDPKDLGEPDPASGSHHAHQPARPQTARPSYPATSTETARLLTSAFQGEAGVSRVSPVPAMKPSRVRGRY